MAKSKTVNPADAHRKAQRKKELQKNKEKRSKARELATVKQDTGEIEDHIRKLETKPELTPADKGRLTTLRSELAHVRKVKEEYVKEHPEHRNLVYTNSNRRPRDDNPSGSGPERKLFGKDGLPLHPERSIYYDPVLNPFGVPPPGMPYIERPITPDPNQDQEMVKQQDEEEEEEDEGYGSVDDIPMPPGPPPGGAESSDETSEDEGHEDVPMPSESSPARSAPPLPKGLPPPNAILARPPGMGPMQGFIPPFMPPPAGSFPLPPPPPPPPGFHVPPPPPGFPQPPPGFPSGMPPIPLPFNMPTPDQFANLPQGAIPPPPMGFPNFPPNLMQPPQPPPPRGFRGAPSQHFDPLSLPGVSVSASPSHPHIQQPHQQQTMPPSAQLPSSLPKKPPPPMSKSSALDENAAGVTVSAAPELRDFKKEATSFVPRGIRQKARAAKEGPRVNAAPATGDHADAGEVDESTGTRPDLMQSLTKAGITGKGKAKSTQAAESQNPNPNASGQDEYARFMDDIGDLLG